MLMIRLSRVGKKKLPEYRIIINEKTKDPWGDVLEFLGYYNPRTQPPRLDVKTDRVEYWLSKGAQLSDTVKNLFIEKGIVKGEKQKPRGIKQKKTVKEKAEEKPAEVTPSGKTESATAEPAATEPGETAQGESPKEPEEAKA